MKTHCIHGHEMADENTYARPDGYTDCRICTRARRLRWRHAHPERAAESRRRWSKANPERNREQRRRWRRKAAPEVLRAQERRKHLRRAYGLTQNDYNEMLESQNYVCAICKAPYDDQRALCVDHDHDTGAIRGLLCNNCNQGIGLLGDNCEGMSQALRYLERCRSEIKNNV